MKNFLLVLFCFAIAWTAWHNKAAIAYAASRSAQAGTTTDSDKQATQVSAAATPQADKKQLIEAGHALFEQNCAFCHGRDAEGGEIGPDLTQSKLVHADENGNNISVVVRNGRPDQKMPAFNFNDQQMRGLVAFIHAQEAKAEAQNGGRRGVSIADLQTGNAAAGKAYFNGAGTCARCHSATGDLAGVASRYQGLQLEERMLYPEHVLSRITVTLPSGKQVAGTVAYLDEFTVALRDANGNYRSWKIGTVKYSIEAPVDAHAELLAKYTDNDIHNLMAYLQTLR